MKKIFNKFLIGFLFVLGIILIPTFKVDAAMTVIVKVDGVAANKTVDYNSNIQISWISTGAASCSEGKGRGGTGQTGSFSVNSIQATETFTVNCTRVDPSITEISNTPMCTSVTGPQGGPYTCTAYLKRAQTFLIGDSVLPGDVFEVMVYSHGVSATAVAGDTAASITAKLKNAVGATTETQWNDHSSAPKSGTVGFKPTTSRMANNNELGLVLDFQHQFGSGVTPTSN